MDEIAGKAVYIEDDNAPELTLEEDGFAALVGWMVLTPETPDQVGCDEEDKVGCDEEDKVGCDEDGQDVIAGVTGNLYEVGEITDFIDIPNNPCIEVEPENGAVMLPLHQDLILSVDPENQEIIMQIPAGLL